MLFNSIEFLLFLPIVFLLYWYVLNKRLAVQNILILVASYFFYGWWSYKFMGLLMLSTILDYLYGFWVASPNRTKAKTFLWLSIINNLGILAIFKYYNFFALQFQEVMQILGIGITPFFLEVALPVGISFYTFHGMSYVFDIYRGHQRPVRSFIDYAVFVSFFPLLVAGPIERANHLLPQVQKRRVFDFNQAVSGCRLIILGLFKKIVIADSIAPIVDLVFQDPNNYSTLSLVLAAVGFSMQIYADFSGYSDIATGVARLFGFELLRNFDLPYFSKSIPEFWKRWHISLSSWFRDYVYFPLGGSRNGLLLSVRNVLIVFVLSAFWHGANWTFLVWGIIHALCYLPGFVSKQKGKGSKYSNSENNQLSGFISVLLTFTVVTFAWVFFRAESIQGAFVFLKSFQNGGFSLDVLKTGAHWGMFVKFLVGIVLLFFVEYIYLRKGKHIPNVWMWVLLFSIVYLGSYRNAVQFIYFQF